MTISRRALAALVAAIVLAAIALGSCGGKAALSAPVLRRDASKLCTITKRRTAAIGTPKSVKDAGAFLVRGLAALGPELAALRLLNPPSRAAPTYARALRALAGEITAMQSTVAAIGRGADPIGAFGSLQAALAPLEARADEAFRALDIDACMSR